MPEKKLAVVDERPENLSLRRANLLFHQAAAHKLSCSASAALGSDPLTVIGDQLGRPTPIADAEPTGTLFG